MTAEHCVDYLSHQWSCDDLILTYRQIHKQQSHHSSQPMKSEQNKTIRLQNALWRSMARCCINHLGKSNQLIDPSTVYWQKESDITWLYGPMYTNHSSELDNSQYGTSVLQGLKPVLKKHCNVAQILPNCSDPILSYLDSSVLTIHTPTLSTGRSSFSSIASSHKSSVGVHFNPEIIEIEYQPEYPIAPSSLIEEDEDDDLVDFFWSLFLRTLFSIKSSFYARLVFLSRFVFYHHHKSKRQLLSHHHLHFVVMITSMFKSVLSLTTTWLFYQSLLPISWITKKPVSPFAAGHKKHISNL